MTSSASWPLLACCRIPSVSTVQTTVLSRCLLAWRLRMCVCVCVCMLCYACVYAQGVRSCYSTTLVMLVCIYTGVLLQCSLGRSVGMRRALTRHGCRLTSLCQAVPTSLIWPALSSIRRVAPISSYASGTARLQTLPCTPSYPATSLPDKLPTLLALAPELSSLLQLLTDS